MKVRLTLGLVFLATALAFAQHDHAAVQHNDAQHAAMNQRGDHAMGFSQDKTTHHFRILDDGGAIEISANDPKDKASVDQIRMHLKHISQMFAEGDFSIPMLVHDENPPGAAKMKELRSSLKYSFEELPTGGRVRIRSSDSAANAAVHEFLRYQIREHRTGDPQ